MNQAVDVEGFARDSSCANSIRSLSDREVLKHVGEVEGSRPWWESVLAQVEQVSEGIREKVETFEEREEVLRERFAEVAD